MTVYIINLLLLFIFGIIYYYSGKRRVSKILLITIISTYMIILISFRSYNVGWDTLNYVDFYRAISNFTLSQIVNFNTELEKGYMILQLIVSKISDSPTLLFLIIGSLYILSFSNLINKYSKEPILSFLLFITLGFFTFGMTAVRQSLALAIVFFSIPHVLRRKIFPFLLIVIFAAFFHKTALIFLPAYWLLSIKINRKRLLIGLFIIPLFFAFRYQIFEFLTIFTGFEYSPLDQEGPLVLGSFMVIIYIGIILLWPKLKKSEPATHFFILCMFSGLTLSVLAFVHPAALRAAYYYIVYIIILIPSILNAIIDSKTRAIIYAFSIAVLLILYGINLYSPSPFVPYEFIIGF